MLTLYFLAVLKLKVKESFAYEEEWMNLTIKSTWKLPELFVML